MKKFITLLTVLGALSLKAAPDLSTTITIAPAGMSNFITAFQGSALVTSMILTPPANNTASVFAVDNSTNNTYFTNGAYIGVSSYATNYYQCYTNFFGATNCITNIAIVDITNTVAAAAVVAVRPITFTASTNQSAILYGNWFFGRGVWVTNTGSGNATVTITYRQF